MGDSPKYGHNNYYKYKEKYSNFTVNRDHSYKK